MRKTVAFIGAGILTATVTACGGGTQAAGGDRTLTLAESVAATPWDLAKASMGPESQYYQPVYDTLIRLNTKGEPTPNLATSWSYDKAQTTLRLKLREGVKFTDGTALDADAVRKSLLHTKSGTASAAGEIQDITGVDVVDSHTVAIRLSHPTAALLPALGQVSGMIASPKALENPRTPIGSGPYKMDTAATTAGQTYTYTRNAGYWNTKAFPYDKIVIKYLADPTARTNALLSGQLDGATLNLNRVATVKGRGLNVVTYQPGDIEGLYIWDRAGKKVPALGKLKVRQALNHAFDREAIIKSAKTGLGTPTTQMFAKGEDGYKAALDETYTYDPEKARKLLAEAGYPNGFAVTIPDLSTNFPQEQAALTQSLKDIGIKVKLDTLPSDQIFSAMLSGKYAMSYFKLGAPTAWDKVQLELTKKSTWNPFKYSDPKADGLIDRIGRSTGAEREALFEELNTYVVDQAWNAPWNVIANAYETAKDVKVTPQPGSQYPPIYNYAPAAK
ncbi:ABC transporter substrate-binding protein [Streptomyces acidicola]|uniref:Peptide ABC transporter substrate-binding protein n=1 Tax=Streptomyces acidicola TaxID=2596892 RepID=A0A5N8WKE3_9ACTN|nr:ABC transporter substrate-binding protein [Streptomyces acidicola]MPY47933.1 peptide ABC transporter substrate-binding protein [Streptomyces acidicola]